MTAKDPALRILGGCALVGAGLVVLLVVAVTLIGWRLTRDETRGRAEEMFLTGDEARYWCFDLSPEDPGLAALGARVKASADEARDEALKNSPLRFLGVGGGRNPVDEMLPLKIEIAAAEEGWAARAAFSKGVLRIRAAMKVLRWVAGRDLEGTATIRSDGVQITTFRDPGAGARFAITMVGNRVLLADDTDRLVRALSTSGGGAAAVHPSIPDLHESVRTDGEDGWAFAPGPAVASFDVNEADELAFRIVALDAALDGDRALALARTMLPYFAEDAVRLDPDSPQRQGDGRWLVTGRIAGFSAKMRSAVLRFSAERTDEPEEPSATPTPPSPPPSSGPRSGTDGAPTREGTPSPPR